MIDWMRWPGRKNWIEQGKQLYVDGVSTTPRCFSLVLTHFSCSVLLKRTIYNVWQQDYIEGKSPKLWTLQALHIDFFNSWKQHDEPPIIFLGAWKRKKSSYLKKKRKKENKQSGNDLPFSYTFTILPIRIYYNSFILQTFDKHLIGARHKYWVLRGHDLYYHDPCPS